MIQSSGARNANTEGRLKSVFWLLSQKKRIVRFLCSTIVGNGSVQTGGGKMSNYIRLKDLTRKERRILNRIVRRQRKEVKRK